ncbi:PEP-CTERM sorting domain-containing protein [Thalassotalea agariperforans]
MKLTIKKLFVVGITLLSVSNISYAGTVKSCNTGGSYDYGDATGYGEACHDTNAWQQLGRATTKDDNKVVNRIDLQGDSGTTNDTISENRGWNAETSQKAKDQGDNGVRWRVKNTDGTWSSWGRDELAQGQTVEFKFVVQRSVEGNHQFDQLKAWVDWNGNGIFENDGSETLIDEKWYKVADSFAAGNTSGNQGGGYNNDSLVNGGVHNSIRNSDVTITNVRVIKQIPYDAAIEDVWLRARIICENSLTHSDRNNNIFLPTGYYHQGEVEDYKLAINHVPEPTTLLVFASALFGLMLNRKKSV